MASTRPSAQRRAPRSKERTSPCLLPASGLPGSTGVVIRAFLKSLRIIPCHLLADYSETVPMFIDEARTRDRVVSEAKRIWSNLLLLGCRGDFPSFVPLLRKKVWPNLTLSMPRPRPGGDLPRRLPCLTASPAS